MKNIKLALLTGAIVCAAIGAKAQSAADVVKKHNDAIGGTQNWAKITTLKKDGTMTVMGMDMPCTFTIVKGKGMRQDFTVMGSANYVIMTPTGGWMYIPAQGATEPTPMPEEQLKDVADQLDFQDKLMDASNKKYKIEMLGKETIDGQECYKLKATDAGKKERTYYIDAKTYYTVRTVETANVQGQDMEVTVDYSDYKKLPEGIVVAMKEDSGDSGTMTYKTIEANTIKDESIFKLPAK
jgi:hypothetical protein